VQGNQTQATNRRVPRPRETNVHARETDNHSNGSGAAETANLRKKAPCPLDRQAAS